jgi:halimadienyl-diphosphate synthase
VVLTALLRHGRDRAPDCLLGYLTDRHFACFPGERTPSTSTNAHALEAIEWFLPTHPAHRARFARPADLARRWLLETQAADGSWSDKWHASPYYATVCCVQALRLRADPASRRAVGRAVEWVLDTQRRDGSWGRWGATVEETAYAVQILALGLGERRTGGGRDVGRSLSSGAAFLRVRPVTAGHPGLWHAKDLYAPIRVIRAARLSALAMAAAVTVTADAAAAPPAPAAVALRLPAQRSVPARAAQPARSGTGAAARPR